MALFSGNDLRDAARALRRSPTISACAILCLALGLGVTTAISSAIDKALLQAPPFNDPGSLVTVYRTTPHFKTGPFSAPNYLDLSRHARQLTIAAVSYGTSLLTVGGEATQVSVLNTTGNLFPMLGVKAQAGRLLLPADDARDQPRVVVLSDELWHSQFAGDPSIVGRSILLDGNQVTVVGIAPRDFRIPRGPSVLKAQVWEPLRFTDNQLQQRGSNFMPALGRLAPGATLASAQREMDDLFNGLVTVYPDLKGEGIRVVPLTVDATASVRTPLLLMLGAVLMVLLIAATDVASLLLARGVHRRRETAIRSALGGSRWAVMRPVFLESVLLAMIGALLGLGLAWAGVRTIGALATRRLPQLAGLTVDLRVIGFALLMALIVAIACGVAPAWRTASVDPQDALRDGRGGGMGRGQHRLLAALVIGEVALSLMLMIGAGLVLRGFSKLVHSDPGFDPAPIVTLAVTVSPQAYTGQEGPTRHFLNPALDAIRQLPGIEAASSIQLLPYDSWGWNGNTRYEGEPADNRTQRPLVEFRMVANDFFKVTGQKLLSGRTLLPSDDDRPESPYVVVVNEALVKRDFKGVDPIGKRFYTGDSTFGTIVGVVSNIRNVGPFAPPTAEMYSTYLQSGNGFSSFPLMIRVRHGDPLAVVPAIRKAIRAIDPLAAVTNVRSMDEVMTASVGAPRFYLLLLATFAIVAIVLAVAGLYGVLSFAVAQRTRELGIRSALGSTATRTAALVARQGMLLVAIGVIGGVAGAIALTRLLSGLLYGVSPLDPLAWLSACALLATAGLAATLVPSWRASRTDPLTAMRGE
ncbi:MAG TPA: ABC transporter permease [Gemmatimonadales bacterium]|jgi:predicted permease